MLNEAMHVLMEGIAKAEDIDTAMTLGYDMQDGSARDGGHHRVWTRS